MKFEYEERLYPDVFAEGSFIIYFLQKQTNRADGKTRLLPEVRKHYPHRIKKYCEPFVGGGAVLFDVLQKCHPEKVLVNDVNEKLINTYLQIKN